MIVRRVRRNEKKRGWERLWRIWYLAIIIRGSRNIVNPINGAEREFTSIIGVLKEESNIGLWIKVSV